MSLPENDRLKAFNEAPWTVFLSRTALPGSLGLLIVFGGFIYQGDQSREEKQFQQITDQLKDIRDNENKDSVAAALASQNLSSLSDVTRDNHTRIDVTNTRIDNVITDLYNLRIELIHLQDAYGAQAKSYDGHEGPHHN